MSSIELGLDTFGDVTLDADGRPLPHAHVLRNVLISAPEVLLADMGKQVRKVVYVPNRLLNLAVG